MKEANATKYVNEAVNTVWLSGWARPGSEPDEMLLCQSDNPTQQFPIKLRPGQRRPRVDTPCEVKCHAYDYAGEGGRNWVRLEAIHIKRASMSAGPRQRMLLNALRPRGGAAFNPFAKDEDIREEIQSSLSLNEEALEGLLKSGAKRARRDGYLNRATFSGFVGQKAMVAPTDNGSGDLGYIYFQLMQRDDLRSGLPVRVLGNDQNLKSTLKAIHPVSVAGEVKVELVRTGESAEPLRLLFIRTDRHSVGQATAGDYQNGAFPQWWRKLINEHFKQQAELKQQSRDLKAVRPTSEQPQDKRALFMAAVTESDAAAPAAGVTVAESF